jgi:hypothetical protein
MNEPLDPPDDMECPRCNISNRQECSYCNGDGMVLVCEYNRRMRQEIARD